MEVVEACCRDVVEAESPHAERDERGGDESQFGGKAEAAGAEVDGVESGEVEGGRAHACEAAAPGGEGGEEGQAAQDETVVGEEAAAGDEQRGQTGEIVQEEESRVTADQRRLLSLRQIYGQSTHVTARR